MGLLDTIGSKFASMYDTENPNYEKAQALLGLSQGLLAASGPTRMPTSFGQALGSGLSGMGQGFQQARSTLLAKQKEKRLGDYQTMLENFYKKYGLGGGQPPSPDGASPPPGLPMGTSITVGPRGPQISIDPAAGQKAELERKRAVDEGIIPPAQIPVPSQAPQPAAPSQSPQIPLPAGMAPKDQRALIKKRAEEMPKDEAMMQSLSASVDTTVGQIDELLKNKEGLSMATGKTRYTGAHLIPGTKAYDADRGLSTIKGQTALASLKELKSTGATMGALNQSELTLLENAIRSLDAGQMDETVIKNLGSIREITLKVKQRAEENFRKKHGIPEPKPATQDGWSVRAK